VRVETSGGSEGSEGSRENRELSWEIFLIAAAVILLEISYTRIFSFKVFYYFTYLVIGISLLGLGAGGVFVAIFPQFRRLPPPRLIPLLCSIAGAAVPAGYGVVALVQLNASELTSSPLELLKLGGICTAMFVPFLLAGVAVATILGARPEKIGRLYFADLLGAGLGCASVIYMMQAFTPPGCVVVSGLLFAIAGLRLAWSEWPALLPVGIVVVLGTLAALFVPGALPDPIPDKAKNMAPHKLITDVELLHSQWSPVFRVDVISIRDGSELGLGGRHYLSHDGIIGSSVEPYGGDSTNPRLFEHDARSVPFRLLDEDASVVIIGAAGGREVLASLHFGVGEVVAVELNPVTCSLMTGKLAEFSGNIMADPRVTLLNAEGRNFVGQLSRDYDLIWLVAPDSYSAMNASAAGAFVLSESYLYTVEMVTASFSHLGRHGLLCAQFGDIDFGTRPKRSTRYLATAREALKRMGIEDFERHVLVGTAPGFLWPGTTILLKPTPFTEEEVRRFRDGFASIDRNRVGSQRSQQPAAETDYRERPIIWHAAGGAVDVSGTHPVNRVISLPQSQLEDWLESFQYDVSPVFDDSPFFWHFVRFRDALVGDWGAKPFVWDPEEATGERILLILLMFSVAFAAVMLLLPLLTIRGVWRQLPCKPNAWLYFSALGLGFMFFEVSLIQQLTLFLGYPTYSLTVTLFSILVSAGLGSLLSTRYAGDRNRALIVLLSALVVLMLWYQFGMNPLVHRLTGIAFPLRVAAAIAFVAPLGLTLGAFMPIGLTAIANITCHQREYIAWSWAVNGFASVVASILATILSMSFGFRWLLAIAVAIYGVGTLAMIRIPRAIPDLERDGTSNGVLVDSSGG